MQELIIVHAWLTGLVLPILGALPDAFIIAVSGLAGGQEEAQEQVPAVQVPVLTQAYHCPASGFFCKCIS